MTQYLILHKVRGEPAFDIAEPIEIGDEEGWIIPTSGHRAYPVRTWPLSRFIQVNIEKMDLMEVRDHYEEVEVPAKKGMGLTIDIGKILSSRLPKMKRRM